MRHTLTMNCRTEGLYKVGSLVRLQTPAGYMAAYRINDTIDSCRVIEIEDVPDITPQQILDPKLSTIFLNELPN